MSLKIYQILPNSQWVPLFLRSAFFGVNLLILSWKLYLLIATFQILLKFIKWSSLQKSVSKFTPKQFYEIDPLSESHKTIWSKITHTFCKLECSINMCFICCIAKKRDSLHNRKNNFTPKMFYEIDPWTEFSTLRCGKTCISHAIARIPKKSTSNRQFCPNNLQVPCYFNGTFNKGKTLNWR